MPNPTNKNPTSGTGGPVGQSQQNIRGGREENVPSSVRGGSQRPSAGGSGGSGGSSGTGGIGGQSGQSGQSQYGGSGGGSGRDPSQRVTSKPDVTLGNTSETAILRTCANTCYETFIYGIREGKQFEAERLIVLLDAAESCTFVANLVARGSEYADSIKSCTAEIVKAAEEMCEEYQDDDALFKACADVARECYEHLNANA